MILDRKLSTDAAAVKESYLFSPTAVFGDIFCSITDDHFLVFVEFRATNPVRQRCALYSRTVRQNKKKFTYHRLKLIGWDWSVAGMINDKAWYCQRQS